MTYAPQDADQHDDVPSKGHGFINAFDTADSLIRRVASKVPSAFPGGSCRPAERVAWRRLALFFICLV